MFMTRASWATPRKTRGIAGLLPMQIGQDGLGAGPVRMDEQAMLGAAGQGVRQHLAEGAGKEAGMLPGDGFVDVPLVGGGAPVFVAGGLGHGGKYRQSRPGAGQRRRMSTGADRGLRAPAPWARMK